MTEFRPLASDILASPQISVTDVATAKAAGITLIVNNRPDGEEAGQPESAEIEAAAKTLGIDYLAIPIASDFDAAKADCLREALDSNPGKALLFCRTGTRSAHLWGLAQARQGVSFDDIEKAGSEAGYDLSRVRMLAG